MSNEFVKLKEDIYTEINTRSAVDHILAKIMYREEPLIDEERRAMVEFIASYHFVYDFDKVEGLVKEKMILKLSGAEGIFGEEQ